MQMGSTTSSWGKYRPCSIGVDGRPLKWTGEAAMIQTICEQSNMLSFRPGSDVWRNGSTWHV